METEYEIRQREFGQSYQDFEPDDLRRMIVGAGKRLADLCLNEAAVGEAMKTLHLHLGLTTDTSAHVESWEKLWADTPVGDLLDLPLAQRIVSLNAYAYFGLSPRDDNDACTTNDIRNATKAVEAALKPGDADASATPDIDRTLLAAQARLALDDGSGPTPDQLAALTRLGSKSMRNALTPSSGSGLELRDGRITATSALKWLSGRGDFKTSIWRHVQAPKHQTEPARYATGEILWIPFASDNTEFHPTSCLRAGKFTIGPKSDERNVADYREALGHLARMRPAAYWRRPNTAGNWGIVTAAGFRPRTVEELGLTSVGSPR